MEISKNCNQPAFGMKFIDNSAMREVFKYAKDTKQLKTLDNALNSLLSANEGDVLLIHGRTPDGKVYSNLNLGHRCSQNSGISSPEEASFNGIVELAELGRKFRSLVGGNAKDSLTPEKMMQRYLSGYKKQ